jgi:hypothetical protein
MLVSKICKCENKQSTRWHYNPETGNNVGGGGGASDSVYNLYFDWVASFSDESQTQV